MKNNFPTQEQVHHECYCEGEPIGIFCLFVPLFSHLITRKYLLTATAVAWCLKWGAGLLGWLLAAQTISMQSLKESSSSAVLRSSHMSEDHMAIPAQKSRGCTLKMAEGRRSFGVSPRTGSARPIGCYRTAVKQNV